MKQIQNYKERQWLRVRNTALRRDKYMDQYLLRFGVTKQAELVHHIFPVEDFPEYQYELWNLISVTKKTHNKFHDRNTDELTKTGKDLLITTARKNKIPIPDDYLAKKRPMKQDRFYYDPPI